MSEWQGIQWKLWAKIGGVEVDVLAATTSFALNSIPRCTVKLPLGREVTTRKTSSVHQIIRNLTQEQDFELFLSAKSVQGQGRGDRIPNDTPVRIFYGKTSGPGFNRDGESASYEVHAKHWLAELDHSSAVSAASHPDNPSNFSFQAAMNMGGAGSVATWGPFSNDSVITSSALSDFWEGGLKPFLTTLTETEFFSKEKFPGTVGSNNDGAKEALKKLVNGVKISLIRDGLDSDGIASAISSMLQKTTYDSFINQTLWNKLVGEIFPMFMLAVVPRVEDALVIPYVPTLRDHYITIKGSGQNVLGLAGETPRALQAVGVVAGIRGSETGYSNRVFDVPIGIGGWFQPKDRKTGAVQLKSAPSWMTNPVVGYKYTEQSTARGVGVVSTTFSPGEGTKTSITSPQQTIEKNRLILNNYAQYLYNADVLRDRGGSIHGKFRLDICPGSIVAIEGTSDAFIADDTFSDTSYGVVTQLTSVLSADPPQAATTLVVGAYRTEAENVDDSTSIPGHPVWETPFKGATLVKEYQDQSKE